MRGEVKEIYKIFDSQDREIVIPVYQRNYDWTRHQCARLFQDLEDVIATGRKSHFFGAVVGQPEGSWRWVVIDGQQRLTTISLLTLALVHSIRDGSIECADPEFADKLERSYLTCGSERSRKLKLKPVKGDKLNYERLFHSPADADASTSIADNYAFFREKLAATTLTAETLWDRGVLALEAMILDLEPHDEPQRIFESLNSTGLSLTEADKIRNFVLMDRTTTDQERIYEEIWNPIEVDVQFRTDWYIRWFLTIVLGRTPKESRVYEEFRNYCAKTNDRNTILTEMRTYAQLLSNLREAATGHPAVDKALRRFAPIRGDVTLPFLLPLLRDVERGLVDAGDAAKTISLLENYVFRRIACSVAANSLNKIFASLYGEMSRLRGKDDSVRDVTAYLLLRRAGTSGRMPEDEEFERALSTRQVYKMPPGYRAYIFDRLENGASHDRRDIAGMLEAGDLTIEHIMPQTLTEAWRRALGNEAAQIHKRLVHTLGNLTVTGYNASYSNRSFAEKKRMPGGFDESPFRLNKELKQHDSWGPEEITARAHALAVEARDMWPYPSTSFTPPAFASGREPMGDDASFTGVRPIGYIFGESERSVRTWKELLIGVLTDLLDSHGGEVVRFAESEQDRTFVHASESLDSRWAELPRDLALLTHTSTESKLRLLRTLFDYLGLETDALIFLFKKDHNGNAVATEEEGYEAGPYARLIDLADECDLIADGRLGHDERASVLKRLREALAAETTDADVLEGTPPAAVLSPDSVASQPPARIVAALGVLDRMGNQVGMPLLENAIADGTLSRALAAVARTNP